LNTYTHTFVAECPNNGERITYSLAVTKATQIMVEDIKSAVADHPKGFHEDIAHALWERLVGHHVHTGGVVAVARCCTDTEIPVTSQGVQP
jgi:hypothetical protein